MAETAIRNLSVQDQERLEKYKSEKGEKTNSKAFVMALHDYFLQKEKIKDLEKEVSEYKSNIHKLKAKYQTYDVVFSGIKTILKDHS